VEEGSDLIAHLLMYFNAKHIPLSALMQELNCRANQ
jgi:phosphoribosyl-ATP pyrophosphohydrolase